ncbi:hypothetical protein RRG08_032374 [Elysia crispata]|uniref:Uncharacterized protein n=1 Tax=Elysia crispata TaxID=231223 RepID=A0AAE1AGF4_9GAST|nr:hypothetical protein RRG08_032374 [Elysia crispata]
MPVQSGYGAAIFNHVMLEMLICPQRVLGARYLYFHPHLEYPMTWTQIWVANEGRDTCAARDRSSVKGIVSTLLDEDNLPFNDRDSVNSTGLG